MRKFVRLVCLLLVFSSVMTMPALAVTDNMPRGSNYFTSRLGYLHQTHPTIFQVWGEVTAVGPMDKLGMSSITVQRSSDNQNWTDVKTYTKENNSNLVASNTTCHEAYVTYVGTAGYYYRAKITLYAENSTGVGERIRYTSPIQL